MLLLFLLLVLFQHLLTYLIDFEERNLALVDMEHFLPDCSPIFFSNIKFSKKWTDYWISCIKSRNVLQKGLQRVLSPQSIFTYWVKFLSKASIDNSVSCHVMVNFCLHGFGGIWSSKDVFLNIFWWLWYVSIASNFFKEIRTQKIISHIPVKVSHVAGRKIFQPALFNFLMKFTSWQRIKTNFRHFDKIIYLD